MKLLKWLTQLRIVRFLFDHNCTINVELVICSSCTIFSIHSLDDMKIQARKQILSWAVKAYNHCKILLTPEVSFDGVRQRLLVASAPAYRVAMGLSVLLCFL